MNAFDLAYQRLNSSQKKAVDTINGPVLVMAGPGTGKTQVLTLRIANIIKQTDTEPSSILALTYTDAATKEMKSRLVNLLGKDGYYVRVSTYHGFCADIIADNPDRYSRPAGMQAVTDLEKVQIVTEILKNNRYSFLKPAGDPFFYNSYIISSISNLKRESVTLSRYQELVTLLEEEYQLEKDTLKKTALIEREKLLGKNQELLDIYGQYEIKLKERGRFDFDDMINWVVTDFENDPDFLLSVQEKYQFILGDEYQDTNNSQNRLIFALSSHWGENADVFVVGDSNQSIFRFQGASKENVLEFETRFPKLTKITLDQNYRSTSNILDASAALMGHSPLRSNISAKNHLIRVAKFNSSLFEDQFLVDTLARKLKKGVKAEDMAVIVRDNADIENLVSMMKRHNLPYRLEGGTNILNTPFISQFIKILKVVTTLPGQVDDLELFIVLNFPYFNLNPLSILKIARQASQNRTSLTDYLLHENPESNPDVIQIFALFQSWSAKSTTKTLPEMFQLIFQESGLEKYLLSLPQPLIELNRFGTLFEDIKKQASAYSDLDLFGYLQNLQLMIDNKIKLEEQDLSSSKNAITLTTAHKSKGLEWKIVFIYRFADSHWGNRTNREMIKLPPGIIALQDLAKEEKDGDEKRLFYVAMTRAKQDLYLLGSTSYLSSKKMTFPSMFIADIPRQFLSFLKVKKYQSNAQKILNQNLIPSENITSIEGESDYLSEIISKFKLSPTALNAYLQCPYKFKLDHLYKIPKTKAPPMCFGTAVHYALENLYLGLINNQLTSKNDFIVDFENALSREILSKSDFQNYLDKGTLALSAYYDHYQNAFVQPLFTEKSFGKSLISEVYLDDIPLTGKVDRIDLLNKREKTVKVVDYKTGKSKTRGEIEGTTQNSNGDYKRQLVFYRLLSELDKNFPYVVSETELDFVEPDKQGNFRQEKFSITTDEVSSLKDVIRDSFKNIRLQKFPRIKDRQICPDCYFYSHCYPNRLSED